MMSRNPLLIAKEHGHRILTMLTVYAAWTEGAVEADFWAIHDAIYRTDLDTLRSRSVRCGKISHGLQLPHLIPPIQPFRVRERHSWGN